MFKGIATALGLNFNDRELKRMSKLVAAINALEPSLEAMSDADLQAQTARFQHRLDQGESLDALLPEAFGTVREAAKRTLGQRPFDVQLIGGIALHEGRIAEMKTGEGKTLAATLPSYLNALTGHGVHVVTVNDYLARRDSEWMGAIHTFLGLDVGLIVHGLEPLQRQGAYRAHITYGTNNEFGFDYLRDNMALSLDELVLRELNYAIVDEVDSILVDEARTPLIISGPGQKPTDLYAEFARIAARLRPDEDYQVDEKAHTVSPTEAGVAKAERAAGVKNLFGGSHMELSHYLISALRAKALMRRDRDYVVKDGEVIIVDQFTGRLMFGRRYSDGLHQAIEAKEGVTIERENQTLATITFQNYFRMYKKLAGMTGTALTEEEEFRKIYGLDVIVIPTNRPMIRVDNPDVVFRTEAGKFQTVVEEIVGCHRRRQPILVGTVSIERSEILSRMLEQRGIEHQVLNAKHHEREAQIIARAGQPGMVTIATNMAGRGTDIVLGAGVTDIGGLHVIGTERHEARRIDNQLRGRSGRQGDPGSSRFYVSFEDDLMRLFASDAVIGLLDRLGMDDSLPIDHPMVSRAIERAQKRVEARNFDLRRQVLQYDDVMNKQRELIYAQRRRVLAGEDLRARLLDMTDEVIGNALAEYASHEYSEEWDLKGLLDALEASFLPPRTLKAEELAKLSRDELAERLQETVRKLYAWREETLGAELLRAVERVVMLRVVDEKWMDHLDAMDDLREGIGLRAYAQRDPLIEYSREAYEMFQAMVASIRDDIVRYAFRVTVAKPPERRQTIAVAPSGQVPDKRPLAAGATGRNDPCPCGSGKKYKKCCGLK
ncbi:MAG: preprotein translocase subunit SecA [Bacillota bacterium]